MTVHARSAAVACGLLLPLALCTLALGQAVDIGSRRELFVDTLSGRPLWLRFVLQDADLYSFQFHDRSMSGPAR